MKDNSYVNKMDKYITIKHNKQTGIISVVTNIYTIDIDKNKWLNNKDENFYSDFKKLQR